MSKGKAKNPEEKARKIREAHKGDRAYNWKGEDVTYTTVHNWVTKWKGNPDTCEKCGIVDSRPLYMHWANIDHKYLRVLDDYIRLCAKCHFAYDVEHGFRKWIIRDRSKE